MRNAVRNNAITKWIDNLRTIYTRIGKTKHGVGVIAIRHIPVGTDPFQGDISSLLAIPKAVIDALKITPELAEMINDFCPLKKGLYQVPLDGFNNIGVGWYLNHSNTPNMVTYDGSLTFIAARDIMKGEELTINYNTYDDQKDNFEEAWRL